MISYDHAGEHEHVDADVDTDGDVYDSCQGTKGGRDEGTKGQGDKGTMGSGYHPAFDHFIEGKKGKLCLRLILKFPDRHISLKEPVRGRIPESSLHSGHRQVS